MLGNFQGKVVNMTRTLLWHPELAGPYQVFGMKLRRGILPDHDLELIVMRIAWLCRTETGWGGHVAPAKQSGISDDDLVRIIKGPDAEGLAPFDATLLRAIDELHGNSTITDETWGQLSTVYDRAQLIELVMVVGNYFMLGYMMNAFGIQPEPGWPGFPET